MKQKPDLLPIDYYLNQIDEDLFKKEVANVEEGQRQLGEYDLEDARQMVVNACSEYLPSDVANIYVEKVEDKGSLIVPTLSAPFNYRQDIVGTFLEDCLLFNGKYNGRRVVIDWKTSRSTLDTVWKNRLLDSWQWKLYAAMSGAAVILYRGISRITGKCREVAIEVPNSNTESVSDYLLGQNEKIQSLIKSGLEVWPRNMPSACTMFNDQCPHYYDCRKETMPRNVDLQLKSISYSSLQVLDQCNEKFRRRMISGKDEDSEASSFGNAVHRGLSAIYKQIFKIKEQEIGVVA